MKIALTFDVERDIPNFLNTDFGVKVGLIKILSVLDDFQIKGTFFCTGTIVRQQPQVIELIENKGHEIACHSFNHERLNKITYKECKEIISKNKKIIENRALNPLIGFRAPYLKPPRFLFQILTDLGFKYDSSIYSKKKAKILQMNNVEIQEFNPLRVYPFFRMPIMFFLIRKWILKKELAILYFHSWEAVNIRSLISTQLDKLNLLKDYFFRLDRWINTGISFIYRIRKFIMEAFSKKAEFVTLRKLATEFNSITK
jgi:peptidoglycan/xylan/chitin deacetylase (PgdA/CDA1 family)